MTKFQITYTEPDSFERITIEREFNDTLAVAGRYPAISAHEWADDLAYTLSDRMDYVIKVAK